MKQQSRKMAVCGMTAALGVVIMLLGAVLGLGMYLSPMLVGLCLIPIGKEWGVKYHLMLWAVIGLLSLILVSNVEQNLMFIGLFGWYPALRPKLQNLPRTLRLCVKLLIFNVIVISLEVLIMTVLVPETMGTVFTVVLLVMGNITFVLYDFAIPRFEIITRKYLKKIFPKR